MTKNLKNLTYNDLREVADRMGFDWETRDEKTQPEYRFEVFYNTEDLGIAMYTCPGYEDLYVYENEVSGELEFDGRCFE